jgi:membrane protease YdiL (CAAX protease family)
VSESSIPPPAASAARPRTGWLKTDPLAGFGAAVLVLVMASTAIVAVTGDEGLDAVLALQGALELTFFGVAAAFALLRYDRIFNVLGFRRPVPGAWWEAAGILLLYIVAAITYAAILGPPEQQDVADELGFHVSTFGAIASGLLIVVIGPIAEETFFRGFLFGSLRASMPMWPAALLSGALFGLIHLSTGEFSLVPPLTLLGILLAWLYARTDSIWPSIAVHCINNAAAFTLLVTS